LIHNNIKNNTIHHINRKINHNYSKIHIKTIHIYDDMFVCKVVWCAKEKEEK